MMGSWIKDQDYLKRGFPFTVEWTNKYLEAEKFIKSFHVYLSTAPGGMSELSYITVCQLKHNEYVSSIGTFKFIV